jgi:hypothetical protein
MTYSHHYCWGGVAMPRWRAGLAFCAGLFLAGCGTTVPEIRDFPNNGSSEKNNELVQAIIDSVRCELRDAVTALINEKSSDPKDKALRLAFEQKWGAQVGLTLRLDEKTAVSPSALSHIPTSVFTLAGGVSGSAEATRVDIVNFYATVRELYMGPRVDGENPKCPRDTAGATDSLLIKSDLKLGEWLDAVFTAFGARTISNVGDKNVLSHQVTFDIVTGADITPGWVWANGAVNQRGLFLELTRDRKHDLLVTFGPIDKSNSGNFLIPIAETTHELSQLANGINSGTQNAVRQ